MLYIVLTYLMLFAALTNAVCLYNASFFAIDFCKCFLFSCFVFVYWHIVCLFHFFISIMHSALICLFFLILCLHRCCCLFLFYIWKGYELSGGIALKNNHYYYYYYYLAQGNNILLPGFEPSTSVTRNRHSNQTTKVVFDVTYVYRCSIQCKSWFGITLISNIKNLFLRVQFQAYRLWMKLEPA